MFSGEMRPLWCGTVMSGPAAVAGGSEGTDAVSVWVALDGAALGAAEAGEAGALAVALARGVVGRRRRAGGAGRAGAAGADSAAPVGGLAGDVRFRGGVVGVAPGAGVVARVRRRVVGVVAPFGETMLGSVPSAMPIPSCWSRFCTLLPSLIRGGSACWSPVSGVVFSLAVCCTAVCCWSYWVGGVRAGDSDEDRG